MSGKPDYLSDAELFSLVAEVEAAPLPAPPDTAERLLRRTRRAGLGRVRPRLSPAEEYRRFCRQVTAAVVAAIFLLFAAPLIRSLLPERASEERRCTQTNTIRSEAVQPPSGTKNLSLEVSYERSQQE